MDDPALPPIDMLELEPRLPLSVDASGQDSLLGSWAVAVEDDALRIATEYDLLSWGLWAWQLEGGEQYPGRIEVEAEVIQSDYWLVLPDFRSGRWDFAGPFSSETVLFELDPQQHAPVNAKGEFYVLVLSQGPCDILVRNLSITPGPPGNYPDDLRKKWLTATTDIEDHCIVDWEGELVEGRSLYRRYAWQQQSEMKRVEGAAGSEHSDSEMISEAFCYYQLFDELPGGELRAASPLALGRRGPEAQGYELRGRLLDHFGRPKPGAELRLSFANLRCSTDPSGQFSFPGLSNGSSSLYYITQGQNKTIALPVINDADLALGDLKLKHRPSGPQYWDYLYAPQEFSLAVIDEDSIELSWRPMLWATDYNIYRLRGTDDWDERLALTTAETTVRLDGEPVGLNRYYVEAVHSQPDWSLSQSPPSEILSFESQRSEIYPDSIYATADRYEVLAGEEVLITVWSHQSAQPINFVKGISVAYPPGVDYVKDSFNLGSPGGTRYGADGIWAPFANIGFLEVAEAWIKEEPIDLPDGPQDMLNFNITPFHDQNDTFTHPDSGEVLNFRLKILEDCPLHFIRFYHINRTVYGQWHGDQDIFWTHDYNDLMPVIRVVDPGEL